MTISGIQCRISGFPVAAAATFLVVLLLFPAIPVTAHAGENHIDGGEEEATSTLDLYLFYSATCPHCQAELSFLQGIEKKYPRLNIHRYSIQNQNKYELLRSLAQEHNAEQYLGSVPLTFVGDDFFAGFDSAEGVGAKIERSIQRQLGSGTAGPDSGENGTTSGRMLDVPLIGSMSTGEYSLPVLAVILGGLDGFNVCSLGALALILGLVITLRSRRKILLYGGAFLATTAVVYGLLIVLWYQLFEQLSAYLGVMQALIAVIAFAGAGYFLWQFRRFRLYGPTCGFSGGRFVTRITNNIQAGFRDSASVFTLAGSIALFAAVITIVEFPCSAAVPVVFAGILAEAQLSPMMYIAYIALFVLFYLLDELVVFGIAAWRMSVWLSSPRLVVWITLTEALILIALGMHYFVALL